MTKILFLEDDIVLAETVVDFLEDEGFEVTHAKNGVIALDYADKQSFDLYLFDVNVPELNGFDLLSKLRAKNDNTATFFITALSDLASMQEGLNAGANDYIKKPFDPDELLLLIRMKIKSVINDRDKEKTITNLEDNLAQAKQESREDFLTKVHNKRALEEKLEELEALYKRTKADYAFCFIDIDFFKNINDTYGHDAGDKVLEDFASLLKKSVREIDFVARFGGEEFAVLVQATPRHGVHTFMEKLRQSVELSTFTYKKKEIKFTISGGVAMRKDVSSVDGLIKKADDYVYEAKHSGRNKIMPFYNLSEDDKV